MNILILNESSPIDWLGVLNTVITTMMSLAIVFLTFQQARIAKMKRKDDLYDKRYKVYDKFREFAKSVIDERGNIQKQKDLLKEAMFHEFLFNEDVKDFMNKIWNKHHLDVARLFFVGYIRIEQGGVSYDNSCSDGDKKTYRDAFDYFSENFLKELRDKFEPYLKLEK